MASSRAGIPTAHWSPMAQAQVKLEFKFPEGQNLTYKSTTRTRQVLTLNGMNRDSVLRETKLCSRSVGKRRDDSTLPIDEKVQFLRAEYTLPDGTKLTLDSSDPNIKIDNPQLAFLADVFKLEDTITYTVVLDKQSKVKAIEGTEKLKEKAEKLTDSIAREEFQHFVHGRQVPIIAQRHVLIVLSCAPTVQPATLKASGRGSAW